ncbi:cupin domain-containing protein [Kribbella sp. NBC_01505]|uniref:cupin domain-containing protein n=1 Tax=Kribbella sp. NBC_01505 TaxID=2903580 RepID=UPI003869B487
MTAEPITRQVVLDEVLPEDLPVRRVEARRITIAPEAAVGTHTHNGPVFGSIESGSAIYQLRDEPEVILQPGDPFYEPADEPIRFDAGPDGVTFLAFFPLRQGQAATLDLL